MADLSHEVHGALFVGGLAITMLAGSELMKRYTSLPRETTRKFAHVGSGFALVSIPFVIDSHWTVLALALGFCALMVATHLAGLLSSVHDVGRGVGGVLWYPFTGWLVYYLVYERLGGDFVLYCIPILVLAAADAFGALVGTSYGRHRYEVMDGQFRSVEGSAAFFVVAFFCVHVPLLLDGTTGRTETLLLSVIIALLAALLETVSVFGLDNLLVPFGVLFILERIDHLDVDQLLLRMALLIACTLIVWLLTWHKPSTAGGAVTLLLMLYGTWTLSGLAWIGPLVGIVIGYGLYERLSPVADAHTKSRYEMGTSVAALAVASMLVGANTLLTGVRLQDALLVAFIASLSCGGAVIYFMLPQNPTFRFKRMRRTVTSKGAWQFGLTPGKLAFALAGASVPVVFALLTAHMRGGLSGDIPAALGTALFGGMVGLATFLAVASNRRAHYACPACGTITLRGLYCCQDERLGDASCEGVLCLTFRKAFFLGNAVGATVALVVTLYA